MPNIEIQCRDCGEFFLFSEGEQKYYAEHKPEPLHEPKRCKPCRTIKKQQRNEQPLPQQAKPMPPDEPERQRSKSNKPNRDRDRGHW